MDKKMELEIRIGNLTASINNFDIEEEAQKVIRERYGKSMQEILAKARMTAKERRDVMIARKKKLENELKLIK